MKDKIKDLKDVKDTIISALKESISNYIMDWNEWMLHFPYK